MSPAPFTVIPAIDLLGGRVVRLVRGDYAAATVYHADPVPLATEFAARGVRRLHVVDLDGARDGHPTQAALVARISAVPGLQVEVGGGLRSLDAIAAALDAAQWAIVGTAALRTPELVRTAAARWPGRILVGVDARDGHVAVNGWLETSETTAETLCLALRDAGVAGVIFTDIARDGTGDGPNVEATARLAEATGLPIIASGGIGSLAHVHALRAAASRGVVGVVVGKALLSGALSLDAALAVSVAP